MGKYSVVSSNSMAERVSVANILLRCGRVLEFRGRGPVRLFDQSAHCTVFHARTQHHTRARPYSVVWCIWNAWNRSHAFLPPRASARPHLEKRPTEDSILVHQHRTLADGAS